MVQPSTEPQCLLTATRKMLRERPKSLTLDKIISDTGLKRTWLNTMLSENESVEPSVIKVQKLFEYLSGEKLLKNFY